MGKKEAPAPLGLFKLILAVASISLLEVILILIGAVSPVTSYSPGNIALLLARLAVFVYAGVIFAKAGAKKAALNGAVLGAADALVICAGSVAGKTLGKPVLGIIVPNTETMILLFLVILVENAALGAVLAGCSSFFARKLGW